MGHRIVPNEKDPIDQNTIHLAKESTKKTVEAMGLVTKHMA